MSHTSLTVAGGSLKPLSEAEQREMGKQLTAQFERTQLAALEIVAFGAMCMEIEAVAIGATCGTNCPADQKAGRFVKGTGLKPWLAKYAPAVSYSTARRYRDVAEALKLELTLKSADQLKLIASPETKTKLEPKLAKKRAQLVDLVSDKSVRGLQAELGLVDEATGHQAPAKKLTPAERRAAWIEAARANALDAFNSVHCLEERWKLLTDDQLALAQKNAAKLAKEIGRWLATAPAKRAALHVEKFLGEEATP